MPFFTLVNIPTELSTNRFLLTKITLIGIIAKDRNLPLSQYENIAIHEENDRRTLKLQ